MHIRLNGCVHTFELLYIYISLFFLYLNDSLVVLVILVQVTERVLQLHSGNRALA